MRRVITLLLATSSASGFVSSPLRLLHRQVVASDSTKLFSSPFFSIELVDADHTTSDGCKCIRIADDTTTTILENMDPNAWAINPSKNASGGIFLSYLPSNQHTSNVDVNMGELSLSNSHKGDHIKWLACARQTRYWMGPAFGMTTINSKASKCLPLDTQFLLTEQKRGQTTTYTLILPLVDGNFRSSLKSGRDARRKSLHNNKRSTKKHSVVCHIDSLDEDVYFKQTPVRAVYIIVGSDPYQLLKQGFRDVADELQTFETLDRKQIPEMVDQFGWCTWDAFYSDVTPAGVLEGVRSLQKAGVSPKTVIIDDGWQTVSPVKPPTAVTENRRLLDQVASSLLSLASRGISTYYDRYVKTNRYKSIPNRVWRRLTTTILKGELYNYFDTETDFARQLNSFMPNEKFSNFEAHNEESNGLRALVTKLKSIGVNQVLCWHALHGYWRGISIELASSLNPQQAMLPREPTDHTPKHSHHLLQVEPVISWDAVSLFSVGILTEKDKLGAFYDGLHSTLVNSGVDGVKIDVQSGLAAVGGGVGGGPHLAKMYVEAMENSVQQRFASDGGINCINCMSHSTENLYHYKKTSVIRAGDDFYPDREYSHTVHIINMAYNSLFLREICLPDWDMFHSKHPSAYLHGAARAVSGGMVYVSDKPNNHDAKLLRRLVLKDGTVLRASQAGVPTRDCLFTDVGRDGVSALKIWNVNNKSWVGLVGAFNVQGVQWDFESHQNVIYDKSPHQVEAVIRAEDVEIFRGMSGPFVAYSHRTQTLTRLDSCTAKIKIPLKHREWELVSISPIHRMDQISFSPIGLTEMFNSGGAISSLQIDNSSLRVELSCRGSGRFLVYSTCRPFEVTLSNGEQQQGSAKVIPFEYNPKSGELLLTLSVDENDTHRLTFQWT